MTTEEKRIQHEHIYETRLGILEAPPIPTAEQHNMAVVEADKDAYDLEHRVASDASRRLLALRDSL